MSGMNKELHIDGTSASASSYSPRNIAVAVGIVAGVGAAGYWFYRRRSKASSGKRGVNSTLSKTNSAKSPAPSSTAATPKQKSLDSKQAGNDLFKKGSYAEAVLRYTDAIDTALKEGPAGAPNGIKAADIAMFYQNRAAAYEKMGKLDKVIEDCTSALGHNKQYTKAILRRAKAYQQLDQHRNSLIDYTAGCVLEQFQNQANLEAADTVLKALGKELASKHAAERGDVCVPISSTFVQSYLSSFCEDPIMNSLPFPSGLDATILTGDGNGNDVDSSLRQNGVLVDEQQTEDENAKLTNYYEKAQQALVDRVYDDVIPLCSKEISKAGDGAVSPHLHEALLLRATFYLILGQSTKALADFEQLFRVLEELPENTARKFRTNAYIKRGSLHMQQNERESALADFMLAEQSEPDNADIYHHRGQLLVLLDDIPKAQKDFDKSVQLRPDFGISAVQRSYCNYRASMESHSMVDIGHSMETFVKTVESFPHCAEGFALLGQAYMEQQRFPEADEMFAKSEKLAPFNANVYVHRGLLDLQWHDDPLKSIAIIKKAIKVDPNCEFAYETLGSVEMQRGKVDSAVSYFDKALKLARTEFEMAHLFTLREAVLAQRKVAEEFGVSVPSMNY